MSYEVDAHFAPDYYIQDSFVYFLGQQVAFSSVVCMDLFFWGSEERNNYLIPRKKIHLIAIRMFCPE